jgi:hypothetical protein
MGSKYIKAAKKTYLNTSMLLYQKKLIEQHYSFLSCKIKDEQLLCEGVIESPDLKNKYQIEITYQVGIEPVSKIISPVEITPNVEIHMYLNRSLCLYYPLDMKWTARTDLYKYTIPWTAEWPHYYELYLINGGAWEGPQSPEHRQIHDI